MSNFADFSEALSFLLKANIMDPVSVLINGVRYSYIYRSFVRAESFRYMVVPTKRIAN